MYLGTFGRVIDDKNRVIIPPKMRSQLGSSFYITISEDQTLELRSESEFANFLGKIEQNNALDPLVKAYKRYVLGNTLNAEIDKIGRFTFNEKHLLAAAIKKEVVFVGIGSSIELWSKENYDAMQEKQNSTSLEELTKAMLKKGIKL